jgi:hypothetical protein
MQYGRACLQVTSTSGLHLNSAVSNSLMAMYIDYTHFNYLFM